MSTEKEEIIIEVKVDQTSALSDLQKLEKAILNNKEAQKELADAYKKGNITQQEYIEENTRLQNNIKKEQDQKKLLTRAIDTESNSRNALKLKVSQLTREYDNLNLKTEAGLKRSKELESQLSALNAQLSKGSKSAGLFREEIGHYPEQFAEAAKELEIGGVSLGSLTAGLEAFINPATAVVGVVGALGAAYEHSAKGAEDFEIASNNLKAAIDVFANDIGNSTDGGIFQNLSLGVTDLASRSKQFFQYILAAMSQQETQLNKIVDKNEQERENIKAAQYYLQRLRDLEVERVEAEEKEKILSMEAIKLQQIRDDASKTFNERIEAANTISEKYGTIAEENIGHLKFQYNLLVRYGEATGKIVDGVNNDRELKIQLLELQGQIAAAAEQEAASNRRNARALIALNNERQKSIDAEKEKLKIFDAQAKEFVQQRDQAQLDLMNSATAATFGEQDSPTKKSDDERLKQEQEFNKALKEVLSDRYELYMSDETNYFSTQMSKTDVMKDIENGELSLNQAYYDIVHGRSEAYSQDAINYVKSQKAKEEANQQLVEGTSKGLSELSKFFKKGSEAQKAFALASILTSEASAIGHLVDMSEGNPLNEFTEGAAGAAQYAAGITEILANIGAALEILNESSNGYSEGGYTGPGGKYQPAGLVHKGEVVWNQQDVAMAGGAAIANAMRPTFKGYADGGIVTRGLTKDINAHVMYSNAIKDMPAPEVSVKEITLAQKRIAIKEITSTI